MQTIMTKFVGEINTGELRNISANHLEVIREYDNDLFSWLEDQYLKGRDIDTQEIAAELEEMAARAPGSKMEPLTGRRLMPPRKERNI